MKNFIYVLLIILISIPIHAQDLEHEINKRVEESYKLVPIGTIIAFAGDEASFEKFLSTRFMICQGQVIEKDKYPVLHAVIRTIWGGGDETAKFSIPDLRGRFLRGASLGSGRDPDISSRINNDEEVRENVGGYQNDTIVSHDHAPPEGLDYPWVTNDFTGDGAIDRSTTTGDAENHHIGGNVQFTGGKETRPKNAGILYIIRVQ